jgi:hypothetical protein
LEEILTTWEKYSGSGERGGARQALHKIHEQFQRFFPIYKFFTVNFKDFFQIRGHTPLAPLDPPLVSTVCP